MTVLAKISKHLELELDEDPHFEGRRMIVRIPRPVSKPLRPHEFQELRKKLKDDSPKQRLTARRKLNRLGLADRYLSWKHTTRAADQWSKNPGRIGARSRKRQPKTEHPEDLIHDWITPV